MKIRIAAVTLLALLGGCASGSGGTRMAPVADPVALAGSLTSATAMDGPTAVIFQWQLTEEGLRLSGRGVARVLPPERARLDLFLGNGEQAARAVLVGEELRLPVLMPGGVIPPPPLLWATLGVYQPGNGRVEARGEGAAREVTVHLDSGEAVRYDFDGDRMMAAFLAQDGSITKEVRLEWGEDELPSRARYRDLASFRELTITREEIQRVSGFPPDIWSTGS